MPSDPLPGCKTAFLDPETGMLSKLCPHCDEVWPLAVDYYELLTKGGRVVRWQSWCRACCAEYRADKRTRQREEAAHV